MMGWMPNRLPALAMIAGLAALTSAAAHAEERLLVLGADVLVAVDREVSCGQPVPVTVRASDRGLFTQDNARLQQLIDGTRAILAFECARMPALEITGELNAEDGTIFEGRAGDETGWLVRSSNWQEATSEPEPDNAGSNGRQVAGLTLGMTRDQVRNRIASEFGDSPVWEDGSDRLLAGDRACLEALGSSAQTGLGQRCLIADFDGTGQNRLIQVTLHQAVDGDQRRDIRDRLLDRYGQPAARQSGDLRAPDARLEEFVRLGWDDPLPEFPQPAGWPADLSDDRYALDAYIASDGEETELTIWMADPASTPGEPEYKAKF